MSSKVDFWRPEEESELETLRYLYSRGSFLFSRISFAGFQEGRNLPPVQRKEFSFFSKKDEKHEFKQLRVAFKSFVIDGFA